MKNSARERDRGREKREIERGTVGERGVALICLPHQFLNVSEGKLAEKIRQRDNGRTSERQREGGREGKGDRDTGILT